MVTQRIRSGTLQEGHSHLCSRWGERYHGRDCPHNEAREQPWRLSDAEFLSSTRYISEFRRSTTSKLSPEVQKKRVKPPAVVEPVWRRWQSRLQTHWPRPRRSRARSPDRPPRL